jgi:Flp pilus assembly pilin Flp
LISVKVCTASSASNAGKSDAPTLSRAVARALSVKSELGVTAIEHEPIASLLGLAVVTAVILIGTDLTRTEMARII